MKYDRLGGLVIVITNSSGLADTSKSSGVCDCLTFLQFLLNPKIHCIPSIKRGFALKEKKLY